VATKATAKLTNDDLLTLLAKLAADIGDTQETEKRLLAQRNAVFAELAGRGVTQVEMARHAGITPMAVAFALRPPERKRGKRSTGR
jgi:hypothetical protein